MFLVFIGHFAIAFIFIVGLYLGATYSGIRYEISEISLIRNKIEQLLIQHTILREQITKSHRQSAVPDLEFAELTAESDVCDKKIICAKTDYNQAVQRFYSRKTSVFAIPVLLLFKKLNQDFIYWD